jgi:hypothetical protein
VSKSKSSGYRVQAQAGRFARLATPLRQIYADKTQISHFATPVMASISKTYQTKVQGMFAPSEPATSLAVCQHTTDYYGHRLGRYVDQR